VPFLGGNLESALDALSHNFRVPGVKFLETPLHGEFRGANHPARRRGRGGRLAE
jgi:hypothetical protein